MAPEIETFRNRFAFEFERLLKVLDGLDENAVNWKPPAPGANSLLVLVTHSLASAEDHVVRRGAGKPVERDRDAEFAATGSASGLAARAVAVRRRIDEALAELDGRLDEPREPPSGRMAELWTVRDGLVHAVAHTAEHVGQAELTRDLWRGRKT